MLDAATGKSVWASLGKHSALYCLCDTFRPSVSAQLRLTFTNVSLLSQLCRTALKAPTETRGTKSCTVKISCDFFYFFGLHLFMFLLTRQPAAGDILNEHFVLDHCSSHNLYVMLHVDAFLMKEILFLLQRSINSMHTVHVTLSEIFMSLLSTRHKLQSLSSITQGKVDW